ncbi:hypothetical protein AZE42_05395 [Rhizopogon vesiculosus]|uniref:F-box domain-containing protein n=1 Tax=Rhizopogon vesiculosus TaxID=180088 RepID=A0A1J8QKC3_9AGAM|nr:hypothetical protein AZE42_05395 [Rhizopogon vesiculosus]
MSPRLSLTGRNTRFRLSSFRSCKQLKHLECTLLDYATWKHLSNLPTLATVKIDQGMYEVQLDRDNVNFTTFLNLTSLKFHLRTATNIITLMQNSEFPSLKVFDIHVVALSHAETEQIFHALSQCEAYQTLEHIVIRSKSTNVQGTDERSLPTATTQLLPFTQLRILKLSLDCPIILDNHLLFEAMSRWPHIRSLELQNTPRVTLRGLFAALRLCPDLHRLAIDIDAVDIDVDPEAESFQHTSLQSLAVGSSKTEDPEAAARIIFSMLPSISHVDHDWNILEWDEVNGQLESLRVSAVNV